MSEGGTQFDEGVLIEGFLYRKNHLMSNLPRTREEEDSPLSKQLKRCSKDWFTEAKVQ